MPDASWCDGDEARHAAALGVGAAHEVAGALRGHEGDVDVGRRHDLVEAHAEAVADEQGVAGGEVGGDVLVEDGLVLGVGPEEHHQIGLGGGVGDRQHPQPGRLGLGHRGRPGPQADAHVDARVLEVQRVGVALRAVADHGDLAAGDERAVGVLLVVHVGHRGVLLLGA